MKIKAYSPKTGNLIADDITGINFGNVRQGQHGVLPVLVRPIKDSSNITGLELYLQNNGGFANSSYGFFKNDSFIPNVRSYIPGMTGSVISDHFSVVPTPPAFSGGIPVNFNNQGEGDFIWLDVQAGAYDTGSTNTVNYRFVFEYS